MSDPDLVYTPIFNNIYEIAKVLPMEDRCALLMANCAYANGEELPEMSDLVRVMFEQVAKPSLDRTINKAKRNRENAKRRAKADPDETQAEPKADPTESEPEANANPERSETEANAKRTESETEANAKPNRSEREANRKRTESETEANASQTQTRLMTNDKGLMTNKVKVCEFADEFAPPSLEEVRAYGDQFCRDRGIPPGGFSAERFVSYNDSRGWRVNGKPMQRWRSAVANWILKDHPEAERGKRGKPDRFAAYD